MLTALGLTFYLNKDGNFDLDHVENYGFLHDVQHAIKIPFSAFSSMFFTVFAPLA